MNHITTVPRILPRAELDDSLAELSDLFAMTSNIYAMSHPEMIRRVDGLFVLNGRDEQIRLKVGIEAWQEHTGCFRCLGIMRSLESVLLRNVTDSAALSAALYPKIIQKRIGRTKGLLVSPMPFSNTKEEARWAADVVKDRGLHSVACITSHEHGLRVMLTFIKQFALRDLARIPILLVNMSLRTNANRIVSDGENGNPASRGWDYYSGEAKRFKEWTGKGDLATFEEFRDYYDWLFDQPITRGISCI